MEIKLERFDKQPDRTIGKLSIQSDPNGEFLPTCFILEDTVRAPGVKVFGKTAIPAGRYKITMTFSQKFQVLLPLLNDVPMFDGIRIHPGNTEAETEGCLLTGQRTVGNDTSIAGTSFAYGMVIMLIYHAWMSNEEIWITIS